MSPLFCKQDLHFEYDVANNINSIINGQNTSYSQTLGYDDAYRLESVTSSADNQFMTYDDVGNRKTHSVNNLNHSYQYSSSSNRLNQYLPNGVVKSIGHDENGNIISDSSRGNTYTYDAFEQLIKLTKNGVDTRYGYNAIGQRAYKANGSSTERYVYSTAGLLLAEPNSAQEYIYYDGQPVGYVKSNQLYYVHNDQLGRPELLTNTSQAVVWKANLKAFDRTVLTSSIGEFNIGFPGQYFDKESGLYYNMFRYYDPQLGRYIQSDPIGLAGGINTYTYVGGNPITGIDPWGLNAITAEGGFWAGTVICGPYCGLVGGAVGFGLGAWGVNELFNSSDELSDNQSADAPGCPTESDGYTPPKNWDGKKQPSPNGRGYGFPDKKGNIWVPTGPNGHGGPHWDVQKSNGGYINVYPGGKTRGGKG